MRYTSILLLTPWLAPTVASVYTGFNYGASWGDQRNGKRYADFYQAFELAQNLTNTPVPFDSARIYTCIATGTQSDPTEAFQAAIDTGTNLLLGMWISPGASGQWNDAQIENELAALGKGFEKHGQQLANLVIGLLVGNEDVYRFNNAAVGVGSGSLLKTVEKARQSIAASPHAKHMQGKPIGHTGTAAYAVVPGSDFIGVTAYPYWEGKPIDDANATLMATLEDTQQRAGNVSVWISKMGWPVQGEQNGEAVASAENYQRYWNEVGCQVFGKYNTFWYELLHDSQPGQPDWGLLDAKTHTPRIRDLSCGRSSATAHAIIRLPAAAASASRPQPTTFSTVLLPNRAVLHATSLLSNTAKTAAAAADASTRTTHTTKTLTTTVAPFDSNALSITTTVSAPQTPIINNGTDDGKISACITMTDLLGDGVYIPVITQASNLSDCDPPAQFTGSPYTMIADISTATPVHAPGSDVCTPTTPAAPSTSNRASGAGGTMCVTLAGAVYEAVVSEGQAHLGKQTSSCSSDAQGRSRLSVPSSTASGLWEGPLRFASLFTPSPTALPASTPSSSASSAISTFPITTPSPSIDLRCITVNGKAWVAATDAQGRRRISGTGVECPTSPPPATPTSN